MIVGSRNSCEYLEATALLPFFDDEDEINKYAHKSRAVRVNTVFRHSRGKFIHDPRQVGSCYCCLGISSDPAHVDEQMSWWCLEFRYIRITLPTDSVYASSSSQSFALQGNKIIGGVFFVPF